jgi:nitrite reductase (NADH) large subunit
VARVGLDYVKKQVVTDGARRAELAQRLGFALQGYADPWAERAATAAPASMRREFQIVEVPVPKVPEVSRG